MMNDNYSPSYTQNNDNDLLFDPSRFQGTSSESADNDIPSLDFDLPADGEDLSGTFYGSYADEIRSASVPSASAEESGIQVLPDNGENGLSSSSQESDTSGLFTMPEEDLVIPDLPVPSSDAARGPSKSMNYETTVKIQNARHAEKDEKRINEPIRKDARPKFTTHATEFDGIASGTAHVSGGLPELKDDQMYVALTPKQLRRLKSRSFRGLGVFSALCLAIIAAFCIWTYVNSFADPIVGRWKGNISSVALGIEALSDLDQESFSSTWEFSSSGTLYVNLVLNDTPVSLSGSYVKMTDEKGEQYLAMTLKNPMDNKDYSVNMYYTVTGNILQFNDMDGVGAEIDLTKE